MSKTTSEQATVTAGIEEQALYQRWSAEVLHIETKLVRHENGQDIMTVNELDNVYRDHFMYFQLLQHMTKRLQLLQLRRTPPPVEEVEEVEELEKAK